METLKLLLGGSPCTHWSIAQTKNRETEPSGIGWELFENYLIAREKYRPDYFLYENNKSMSPAIREQITRELGVEPILINSALVSAQNRQRLYWVGIRQADGTYHKADVEQPEDKGILLRDVLDSAVAWQEKSYALTTRCMGAIPEDTLKKHRHTMVAEPVNTTADGKAQTLRATCYKDGIRNMVANNVDRKTCVAEPVAVDLQVVGRKKNADGVYERSWEARIDGKSSNLTSVESRRMVAEPVRIGCYPSPDGTLKNSQGMRLYDINAKSVNLTAQGGGMGAKTGLYAVPADGKTYPVYEVLNGLITIKDKQYPIKLADGYYIIRKLTVSECMRLQTVPEWYDFSVISNSQAYKMLGNGWTVDVIAHILSHIPRLTEQRIEVLSMYDGMSCGHIALGKLGANVAAYYATEIDKYAIQTTQVNYPNTVQLGDAFQVRDDEWKVPRAYEI